MLLPNRHKSSSSYRYGFQGSEKDDEIKGEGNSYTTYFRQYDSRIGRWLTRDPVKTAWESPYVFSRNNPIVFNDPLGDCPKCDKDPTIKADKAATAILEKYGNRGVSHNFFGVTIRAKRNVKSDVYVAAREAAGMTKWTRLLTDKTPEVLAKIALHDKILQIYDEKATLNYYDKKLEKKYDVLIGLEDNPEIKLALIAHRSSRVNDYKVRVGLISQAVGTLGEATVMYATGRLPAKAAKSRNSAFTGGQLASSTARKQAVNFTDDMFTSFISKEKITVYRVWGGKAKEGGRWFFSKSTKPLITSSDDAIINLKLYNNTATKMSTYEIPAGTRIYVGGIKSGNSGAIQIYTESRAVKIGEAVKL